MTKFARKSTVMKRLLYLFVLLTTWLGAQAVDADKFANYKRYSAANDSLIAAAAYPRVVLIGNSITQHWPERAPHLFESHPDIVGRGISGQTSAQMLLRFSADVIALHPKIVIINAGTNDIALNTGPYDEERTLSNIAAMAQLARANGIRPVLSTVLPASGFAWRPEVTDAMDKIKSLNARIKAYAVDNGFYFIDYFTPLVNDGHTAMREGYAAEPQDKPGVHPNADGYEIMEHVLLKVLNQM